MNSGAVAHEMSCAVDRFVILAYRLCEHYLHCTTTANSMLSAEYELWIQDIVRPASHWPWQIRRFFWTAHLSHWECVRTAVFVWINGLNPEVFYDWCELKSFFARHSTVHQHYKQLFSYFREGWQYRLWHVINRRYKWLDGRVRHPPSHSGASCQ